MAHHRLSDDRYLQHIRALPCLVCGGFSVAHHMMHAEPSATGLRSGDQWAVPLCHLHHTELHAHGDEPLWWALQGVAPVAWAIDTYAEWRKQHAERN